MGELGRRETLRAIVAPRCSKGDRATRETFVTLLRWLEDESASPEPELVLLEAVVARRGHPQEGFWAVAQHLKNGEAGVSLETRRLLLQRLLDRHISTATLFERWTALRDADVAVRRATLESLAHEAARPSLLGAHTLLLPSLRTLPVDALPPLPFHRDEATPHIGGRGYARFALFLARRMSSTLQGSERAAFETALEVAALHAEKNRRPATARLEQATRMKPGSLATIAARAAALEARANSNRPDTAGRAAQNATTKIVEAVLAREGVAGVRALFVDLDDELRRLDVLYAFEEHESRTHAVRRAVIRRGPDGDDGERRTTMWLAELEGGAFALLTKVGRRWVLTEGSRDEILALVPDAWFEDAVRAAASIA